MENKLKASLNTLDWTILTRHLKKNVDKQLKKIILTHQKKLRTLTKSLFTNIPLSETIDLAVETIFKHNPEFPINKANVKELFTFATSQTHFLFNGFFYDQCDGVAIILWVLP